MFSWKKAVVCCQFPGEVWIFLGTTYFEVIVPFALEQGVIPQGLCGILLWQLTVLSVAWKVAPKQIHLGHLHVIWKLFKSFSDAFSRWLIEWWQLKFTETFICSSPVKKDKSGSMRLLNSFRIFGLLISELLNIKCFSNHLMHSGSNPFNIICCIQHDAAPCSWD